MSSGQPINDEAIVKILWRRLRMTWRSPEQLESEANTLIQSMPTALTEQLRENRGNQSLMNRLIGDFVKITKMGQDQRLIEAATRLIQTEGEFYKTHAETSRAKTDAVRAQHEARQVHQTLAREDQLTTLDHKVKVFGAKTRLAEEEAKRASHKTAKAQAEQRRQSLAEPIKVRFRRQLDEALARRRTYIELKAALDKEMADELEAMKKDSVPPEQIERHARDIRRYSESVLKQFARALAKQTAGSSDEGTQ